MAEKDIIQNMILQPGQSRNDRHPPELDSHFVQVEERTPSDLLLFLKKLAAFVHYYRYDIIAPAGDWRPFFPFDDQTVAALRHPASAATPPHLALLLAFLELYEIPKEIINRITGRHLEFYYQEVLQLRKQDPVPDKVHLLLELKKQVAPLEIGPEHLFTAGKDATKVELLYAPTQRTVINSSRVAELRSLFLDTLGRGTVRYAPVANSADGVGGELVGSEPRWPGFGHPGLPPAEVGFALAAPVLRMQEGERTVTVHLTLGNVDRTKITNAALGGALEAYLTGEKHWLGPYDLAPTLDAANVLHFSFTIPATDKAVVDYDAALHGYAYHATAPVVQVLLKPGQANLGYLDLVGITVQKAAIAVEVKNVTSLHLESDAGVLDPKKAFFPFGPQPTVGSRFFVGYPEALAKQLSEIKLTVQWQGAPEKFADTYALYGAPIDDNTYFTARGTFADAGGWEESRSLALFAANAQSAHSLTFTAGGAAEPAPVTSGHKVHALYSAGRGWARREAMRMIRSRPVWSPYRAPAPQPRPGFITFTLEHDFLHAAYRNLYLAQVMAFSKAAGGDLSLPSEPYTPVIQSLKLSYKAYSGEVEVSTPTLEAYADAAVHFFHVSYFGQMREHAYQRQAVGFLTDTQVPLLPAYNHAGELLIGLAGLDPGDSVSLLFQVAEGSADPTLERDAVSWAVLCDNYWRPLGKSDVFRDTTNQMLTSGIINFAIPALATTDNTILPAGLLWLKGAVAQRPAAVCQLINVVANAVEAQFRDQGNDPNHLLASLPKGSITKLKTSLAAVKAIKQPYASFGGQPAEAARAFNTRVSERLRHKNRALTPWDYERLILQAFPQVHKVKCLPHAREGDWLAPGHVLLVVVPDLKNKNAVNPLEPRVDADTLARINDYLGRRTGMQVQIKLQNPAYQKIQLDFKVKFHPGYEFNYYSEALNLALIRFLSPWVADPTRDITFGGRIYKSVLLNFVEEVDYVDYVTDFKLYSYTGDAPSLQDLNEAQPSTPDALLVSAPTHIINRAEGQA